MDIQDSKDIWAFIARTGLEGIILLAFFNCQFIA